MNRTQSQSLAMACIIGFAGMNSSALAQDVVALQGLGGIGSFANDINNHGDIVGQAQLPGGLGTSAVRWDANGIPVALGALGSSSISEAIAINNNGMIVGFSEDSNSLRSGTLWDGRGGMVDIHSAIGSIGASIPWDINDSGVIVGQASINPGFSKGFIWDQTNPVMVAGTPDVYQGGANRGINNSGQIVGSGFFFGDPDDAILAVPDDRGRYEYPVIAPIGFNFSNATSINDSGMMVGHTSFGSTTSGWNAVIYTPDERDPVQVLGTLPTLDTSEALDVNENGMVVGYAWDGTGSGIDPRAWAWIDGTMYDLNDLLDDRSEFEILSRATGVNDHGDIVGFGRLNDGSMGAFVIRGFAAPAPCVADINEDGELNFFDVSMFLNGFNTQDPIADMNDDREFNFFDVSMFLNAFNAGCP